MIVDLGAGTAPRDRADLAIDRLALPAIDVVADAEVGLPLATDSCERVLAYHVLEHVDDLPGVMAELHRILEPGGILEGKVPHHRDADAYHDPTHRQLFTARTFEYWDPTTDFGGFGYFDAEFRVVTAQRVRRFQVWKSRPVRFELRAVA